MLRAIIGVLSLGLLVTLLADVASAAPGRRAARSVAGRTGGAAVHAGGGAARQTVSGRTASGARQLSNATTNFGSTRPTGPIGTSSGIRTGGATSRPPAAPQAAASRFPGIQGGSLNVPSQLPGVSQVPGQWQGQLSNVQGAVQGQLGQMATAYGINVGGASPFSPAWYAQHPNAWKITHPYAGEAAIAATALGLASFMAIESATLSGGGSTTVVYGSEATAEQTQAAAELAQAGEAAVDSAGQWMPIGVFAFRPLDAPNATRMIHLAVNPQGTLRGAHYDLLSEETADIIGAVDRNTAQVSWRIGENGHVVFESNLAQLTQPQGQVRVHFPDGQTGQWAVTQVQQ